MTTTQADWIRERLRKDTALPHEAAAIGAEISRMNTEKGCDVSDLVSDFNNSLLRWGLEDVLRNQIDYAVRLATDPTELLYEEMHKLFSLLDEIYALQQIGLEAPDDLMTELSVTVTKRFQLQASVAKMVASDRVEDWYKGRWWYDTLTN